MKKQLLIFAFAFFLSPYAFSQEYGWKDISGNIPDFPYDTVYNNYGDTIVALLTDVFFINDNEGWITTYHANNDTAAILHTTDGGQTFEVQITLFQCNAIHMLNENEGYAGGKSGFVYRTTDGGENWIHHGSISTTLTDISFPPSGNTGYACGMNGNIWSIDNTGVNKMLSNINGDLGGISFPMSSEEGWVVGGDVLRHFKNNIWNGDQDYPAGHYGAIHMLDMLNGWSVGTKIIHTEDGVNWYDQGVVLSEFLLSVYFLDNQKGWAVGSNGTILQTDNGGIDWNIEGVGLSSSILTGVQFTSPTNGYVVGNDKTLLKYGEILSIGEETQAIAFKLFPNPVSDKFEVWSAEFEVDDGKIELYELSGKKLLEEHIAKGKKSIEIDVSDLESGMYLCNITIGKRSSTKKIVKE